MLLALLKKKRNLTFALAPGESVSFMKYNLHSDILYLIRFKPKVYRFVVRTVQKIVYVNITTLCVN